MAHKRRKPVHGTKALVAIEQDTALIRSVEVMTANVHDAAHLEAVLPTEPVYGDSVFSNAKSGRLILARGGTPMTARTGVWGGPEALVALKAHNAAARRVRCRIEKVFGTCRRSHDLRRMRWPCLAKAGLQVRLTAIAYNLRRCWRLATPVSA